MIVDSVPKESKNNDLAKLSLLIHYLLVGDMQQKTLCNLSPSKTTSVNDKVNQTIHVGQIMTLNN